MVSGPNKISSLQSLDAHSNRVGPPTSNSTATTPSDKTANNNKSLLHSLCIDPRIAQRSNDSYKKTRFQDFNQFKPTSLLSTSNPSSPPRADQQYALGPKPDAISALSEDTSVVTKRSDPAAPPDCAPSAPSAPSAPTFDSSSNALIVISNLRTAPPARSCERARSVMEMHEEGSSILQQFGVHAETDVSQQRTDAHVMPSHDHVQQNTSSAPNIHAMHHSAGLTHPPMSSAIPQASAPISTRPPVMVSHGHQLGPPGPKIHNPIDQNHQRVHQLPRANSAAHVAATSHVHVLPSSTGQEVTSHVVQTSSAGRVPQPAQMSAQMPAQIHRTHQSARISKPGAPMSALDNQTSVDSQQAAVMTDRDSANRAARSQGMDENDMHGDEQGQTNVEGNMANVVPPTVVTHSNAQHVQSNQVQQVQNVQHPKHEQPGMPGVPSTEDHIKKEGMLLQATSASMMNNAVARGLSVGTTTKKSNRMPGTKQCPTCQNTIAAAVAKCPKCPHIFREKKEKVKRSGKRGKKNCPKCSYENPSACSSCKQCKHVFRLKLMDKYKSMRPSRPVNDSNAAAAAAAAHAAASLAAPGTVGAVAPGSMPPAVQIPAYAANQLGHSMHTAASAHAMPVMQPLSAQHALAGLPPHSHSIHPASMAQMHQQIPHSMQPHQQHPQL